jgi:hypothetical protein
MRLCDTADLMQNSPYREIELGGSTRLFVANERDTLVALLGQMGFMPILGKSGHFMKTTRPHPRLGFHAGTRYACFAEVREAPPGFSAHISTEPKRLLS